LSRWAFSPAPQGLQHSMKAQSVFLITLLFTNLLRAQEPALHVTVVAGEGSRQIVSQKSRVDPAVQVEDEKSKPVEGAAVVFTLPSQGPGGSFDNGSKMLTVTTDAQGRATAHGISVNRLKGRFEIRVTASYQGRTANATIAEMNVTHAPHAGGAFGVSTRTWVYAGLVLLAIGGGIFAYKEFKPGPNPNVLTATPGTPTVGGPQ
jgi:hypothetical protein